MVASPYTSQAISGYNSSPPPDDGSVTSANRVTWSGQKTKLADPVKTLSEAINTQLVTAMAKLPLFGIAAKTTNYTMTAADDGRLITWTPTATGTITALSATGVSSGYSVWISHQSNGNGLTISTTGTATHSLNGTVNGSITIGPYQTGILFSDAANYYWLGAGTSTESGQIRQTLSTYSSTQATATIGLVATQNFSDALGTELMTIAVAQQTATTKLLFDIKVQGTYGLDTDVVHIGLFATTATSSLDVNAHYGLISGSTLGQPRALSFAYLATVTSTATRTYSVRAAVRTSTQTFYFNYTATGGQLHGGNSFSHIIAQEF